MIECGAATENDMIVAFLRAEIDSSRYDDHITGHMTQMGFTRKLIDEPNLADANENRARKALLGYRGYEVRRYLFSGFPLDATWRRVALEEADFRELRYANYPVWRDLSDDTRLVSIGARNFRQRPDDPDLY
jgi:hypothetical protein